MSNPWSQAYEDLRKPYYEGKMAKKDYDGDGKIESGTDEYMGSRDKAIKKAMGKKITKEHHQKDADGKVIEHEDTTPSSVEEEQINELSKKTLSDYTRKSATSLAKHSMEFGSKPNKKDQKKLEKRHSGIMKAASKMAKEENVDEMITLTKGDYASRNVVGSAYNTAAKKKFDSKIYKAGGGLGSNFLPLANSQEPEGDMVEAKIDQIDPKNKRNRRNIAKFGPQTKPYDPPTKEMKTSMGKFMQKQRQDMHDKKRGMKKEKMVKKESFSDWRSEFVWEDGDSVKKT